MTMMIEVDRAAVVSAIRQGDSPDGRYYVFFAATEQRAWVGWTRHTDWYAGEYDARIPVPSLVPDGDGSYYSEAAEAWERDAPRVSPDLWAAYQAARQAAEDDGEYWGGYTAHSWIEENDPEWSAAFEENAVDFYVGELEAALNGRGNGADVPEDWEVVDDDFPIHELFEFEIR